MYDSGTTMYGRVARLVREKPHPPWMASTEENFKQFKILVDMSGQYWRYADMCTTLYYIIASSL